MNLLPCPFCGGSASVGRQGKAYFANCVDCLASTNQLIVETMPETEAKAVELWNRRAPTLFGLPIVEVDMPGMGEIAIGEWPATLHVKFTKAETAYIMVNGRLLKPGETLAQVIDEEYAKAFTPLT